MVQSKNFGTSLKSLKENKLDSVKDNVKKKHVSTIHDLIVGRSKISLMCNFTMCSMFSKERKYD